jgi:hypothetical protein
VLDGELMMLLVTTEPRFNVLAQWLVDKTA